MSYARIPSSADPQESETFRRPVASHGLTGLPPPISEAELLQNQQRRRRKRDKIQSIVETVFWISAAVVVIFLTDLPHTLLKDPRANRSFLNLGLICILLEIGLWFYLLLYLRFQGISRTDYENVAPRAVKFGAGVGVAMFFLFLIGFWPVWSWLTPFILGILFMAFIELLTFM